MTSLQVLEYDSQTFRQTQAMKFWSQSKSQSGSPSASYRPIFANYTPTSLSIKSKTKSSEVQTLKQMPFMAPSLRGSSTYHHSQTRIGRKDFMSTLINEETDPYLINSPLKGVENEKPRKKSSKDHYALLGTFPTQQRVDLISPRSNKEDGMSATLRSSSITRFPKEILKIKEEVGPLTLGSVNKLHKKNQTMNKIIGKITTAEKEDLEYRFQPKKKNMENLKINKLFMPKSQSSRAADKKTIVFPTALNADEVDLVSPADSHRKSKRIQKAEKEAKDFERLLETEWTIGEEENQGPYRIRQRINFTRNADRSKKENELQEEQDRAQLVKNVGSKMKEIDSAGGRAMTSSGFGGRKNQKFMVRVQSRASSIRDSIESKNNKDDEEEEEGIKMNNFCTPKSLNTLSENNIFNYGMYFKKKYMEKGTSMEMSKDLQSRIKAFENEIKQSVKRLGTAMGKSRSDL